MSRKTKELYYEVLPPDEDGDDIKTDVDSGGDGSLPEPANEPITVMERDRFAELKAAAERIERVRFRVKPDYTSKLGFIVMLLTAAVLVGGVLMYIIKNTVGVIVVGAVTVAAVIAAIGAMIWQTVKMKRVFYCYFARTERGITCMSAVDGYATVFMDDRAYCIDGEAFFVIDPAEYREYYDGEGVGLYAVLTADKDSVEYDEDGEFYFVKGVSGGGHAVFLEDGEIVKIISDVPRRTDEIDPKTGESKVKIVRFEKIERADSFAWEIPPFVAEAFEQAGVELRLE